MFLFNFTNFMKDLWSDLKDAWLLHKWILCAAAGLIVFFLLLFINNKQTPSNNSITPVTNSK